jgi:hypothetical protein
MALGARGRGVQKVGATAASSRAVVEWPAQAWAGWHGWALARGGRWRWAMGGPRGLCHSPACSRWPWSAVPGQTAVGPDEARRAARRFAATRLDVPRSDRGRR